MKKAMSNAIRVGLLALTVLWVWPADAAHVILTDGRRIEGRDIRARANGDVILSTDRGDLTFARGQYREAWASRPEELNQARRQMDAGRYDQVISTLDPIVSRYRHLSWDIEAMGMIAAAHNAKGSHQDALATYERLFQAAPRRKDDRDLKWGFFEAKLGAERLDALEGELDKLITEGERADAARAQVMRGDVQRQRGRTEAALLDYLRTTILFQAVTDVQAEALYKAGVALQEMRDQRARDMFRKVVREHADSPYAERAQARL